MHCVFALNAQKRVLVVIKIYSLSLFDTYMPSPHFTSKTVQNGKKYTPFETKLVQH